jgi:hypothetical protein
MVLNIGIRPSRVAQGLKIAHDDDTSLVIAIMPQLQQPPKVQTLTTTK